MNYLSLYQCLRLLADLGFESLTLLEKEFFPDSLIQRTLKG